MSHETDAGQPSTTGGTGRPQREHHGATQIGGHLNGPPTHHLGGSHAPFQLGGPHAPFQLGGHGSDDARERFGLNACEHHPKMTDSAGQPWAGRSFRNNPFAGDDGSADPALLAALTAFRDGSGDKVAVVDAYRNARLLIPLITGKGREGIGPHGLKVDKTAELSIVNVAAPDGRKVLPVFTCTQTMTAWDAPSRPSPAEAVRTAVAAIEDDTDLIVIDPGAPTEFVLRRPAVWAIAREIPWLPSHRSDDVRAALEDSIRDEPAVRGVAVADGDPRARLSAPELEVRLRLAEGLDQAQLNAVLSRLSTAWAADERIATLVDSLSVKLVS